MLAAGTTLGPYKILAPLGSGGMGEVYRARDSRLGRDVALKVMPTPLAGEPERIKRFEQEARAAGALNHPNVCTVLDIGTHDGTPFVVMELLEGESLRARLNAGPLAVRKAIDYSAQAAHGLAAAHAKGIVHRDLKPENLFVTKDGRVKVLDFGLAKLTRPEIAPREGDSLSASLTETGAILGTVGYMAPEQVRGQAADHRSDLFALGAILHEMLTGERAFRGDSSVATLYAILNAEPALLSASGREVPPGLETIMRHCLEKNPEERFQSARDLAFNLEALSRAAEGIGPGAVQAPPWLRPRARFGVAAIAVALAGIAFIAGRQVGDRTHTSRVTYRRLTVQRGSVYSARFSPDGKTVFYTAAWDGRLREIFETRPGFLTSRAVGLRQTNLLSISKSGTMAVALGRDSIGSVEWGTLAEVPITGGMPRRVLDDVVAADWSPDGQALAVLHRVGSKVQLEMPPRHVLYQTAGSLGQVRVSPTGKWLAFVENPVPRDTRGRVIIMDATGRVSVQTPEWATVSAVAWSADGREAWFTASQDLASFDIRAITPHGRERVVERFPGGMVLRDVGRDGQVLMTRAFLQVGIRGRRSPADEEHELGWLDFSFARDISSDGQTLLFDEQGIGGGPHYAVCLRGMDGSPPVRIGEGSARSLSPDGQWVMAIHYGPPQRLLLLPTGVGDSTSLPRGRIHDYEDARWLPDGKRIVFVGSEAGHASRTYLQDLTGGLPGPVTPEGIAGVIVSPDGRFVAGVSRDQRLHACPIGGGDPTPVTDLLPRERMLQWASDGRSLYVGRFGGASVSVARIDRETGRRVPWRVFSVPDLAGAGFLSVVLTPDARSYAYSYVRRLDDLYLVEGLK